MNGWKSSFIQLPPLLSVPTLPPSTPLQCRTPSPPTHTHINTHSLPCPLRNTGRGGCVWVGFPNYLSRFQQMVEELSSWGSRCSFPLSQRTWLLHFSPFPWTKQFLFPWPSEKNLRKAKLKSQVLPRPSNLFSVVSAPQRPDCPSRLLLFGPRNFLSSPAVLHCGIRHPAPSPSEDGGANHALRFSNAFPGTGWGVLQGESKFYHITCHI